MCAPLAEGKYILFMSGVQIPFSGFSSLITAFEVNVKTYGILATPLPCSELANNLLANLPETLFDECPLVFEIYLDENPDLGPLPANIFSKTVNLGWIHLAKTGQTSLPATLFANTPKLVTAILYGNHLTGLDPTFFANTPLMNQLYD